MTIRTRLLLFVTGAILFIAAGVISYATVKMREDAYEYYISSSNSRLYLMNDYIESFIRNTIRNAAILAQNQEIANAQDIFPSYVNKDSETIFRFSDLTPEARHLLQPLVALEKSSRNYVEVYAGYANGSLITTFDGLKFAPHFDMSKRPWYQARIKSPDNAGLAETYTSISGEMVFAITHKMKNRAGDVTGVLGIDVTLKGLAAKFEELSKGQHGYFILVENTGKILCDPKHPDFVGKVIGKDFHNPGLMKVLGTQHGTVQIELKGVSNQVNVVTNSFGWKLISIQPEKTIFARSTATLGQLALLTLGLAVIALLGVVWLVRSVNRPLSLIVHTATDISTGNLEATLNPRDYYGELSQLQRALSNMVKTLKARIAEAAKQTDLAQQEAVKVQEAMGLANAARQQAENARREGMLAAARELEGVVGTISTASTQLATQIQQSDKSAAEAAQRLSEAAVEMNTMNATVQEVAQIASSASLASVETKQKAEAGAQVVGRSLRRIQAVHQVSLELKENMEQLNVHAKSINQIMGVISDIADQTNLLALNAAIEAARAGDAGRGFAVVADEVRKLAEKTMASTNDVSNAIKAIHESTAKSTTSVENAVAKIGEATQFANESGRALEEIVATAEITANQVNSIATVSEKQSASSAEITNSILSCNDMSRMISDIMGEAARSVSDMDGLTQGLAGLIENMKRG